jgi:hypothetical protein
VQFNKQLVKLLFLRFRQIRSPFLQNDDAFLQVQLPKPAPAEYYRYVITGEYPLPFPPPNPKTTKVSVEISADTAVTDSSVAEVSDWADLIREPPQA